MASAPHLALLAGAIVGFLVLYVVNYLPQRGGAPGGDAPLQAVVLFFDGACYHLHHWMLAVAALGLAWLHVLGDTVVYGVSGLLVGAALEGALFKDWAHIKGNCSADQAIRVLQRECGGAP